MKTYTSISLCEAKELAVLMFDQCDALDEPTSKMIDDAKKIILSAFDILDTKGISKFLNKLNDKLGYCETETDVYFVLKQADKSLLRRRNGI